jgi:hypothetical protein
VHEQQEKLVSADARLQALQRECFEKVDGATELAEKQNALTMTLEAKVGPHLRLPGRFPPSYF